MGETPALKFKHPDANGAREIPEDFAAMAASMDTRVRPPQVILNPPMQPMDEGGNPILPAQPEPFNGQIVIHSGLGFPGYPGVFHWRLFYDDSADPHMPWHFLGGQPIVIESENTLFLETSTWRGTGWSDDFAIRIKPPMPGIYDLDFQAVVSNANVNWYVMNGFAEEGNVSPYGINGQWRGDATLGTLAWRHRVTIGDWFDCVKWLTNWTTGQPNRPSVTHRSLRVTPVRLGRIL